MLHYVARNNAQIAGALVDRVVNAAPTDVPVAIGLLEPHHDLALPLLRERFRAERSETKQKLHAAFALAALGEPQTEYLILSIARTPSSEAKNLISAISLPGISPNSELLRRLHEEGDPRQKSRYAITLLHLGDSRGVKELLAPSPDPTGRTALILGFKDWHANLFFLSRMLRSDVDPGIRSTLCTAIGLIDPGSLSVEERDELVTALTHLYRAASDGGTHSAAGWVLRRWGLAPASLKGSDRPAEGREWFVNRLEMTMLKMHPGRFVMGAKAVAKGQPHEVRLARPFYLSNYEVTVAQFQKFVEDSQSNNENLHWPGPEKTVSRSPSCPVQRVSWNDAVLFCNWLSRLERRQECYRKHGERWEWVYSADGYRLPTEAEWEYACRAGSSTAFSFGEDDLENPTDFVVYRGNSRSQALPVGTKMPNAWGLFDMHGNVSEWCWDWYGDYPRGDIVSPSGPSAGTLRVYRGGSWSSLSLSECESARRYSRMPSSPNISIGFRVVCGVGS
jgi:formylglycine-generating enzyme required for sulfatase activity